MSNVKPTGIDLKEPTHRKSNRTFPPTALLPYTANSYNNYNTAFNNEINMSGITIETKIVRNIISLFQSPRLHYLWWE